VYPRDVICRLAIVLLLASGCEPEAPNVASEDQPPARLDVEDCVFPALGIQILVLPKHVGHVIIRTDGKRGEVRTNEDLRAYLHDIRMLAPDLTTLFVLVNDEVPDIGRYMFLAQLMSELGFAEPHECGSVRVEGDAEEVARIGRLIRDPAPVPTQPSDDLAGIPEQTPTGHGRPLGVVEVMDVNARGRLTGYPESQALHQRRFFLRSCYEQALKDHPGLHGALEVTVAIAAQGNVQRADITHSSLEDDPLEDCIRGVLGRTPFPPNTGGGRTLVDIRMVLSLPPP